MRFRIFHLLFLFFVATGCSLSGSETGEKVVKEGSVITFDYAAGYDNGTLFDTSIEEAARQADIYNPQRNYQPESVVVGQDPLIPGLEEALIGMKGGESKNLRIPPEKAYGALIPNATADLSKSVFENPGQLEVGEVVIISTPEGQRFPVFVKKINEDNITVDQNHPLAGQFIQFAVILRSVE